MMMAVMGLSLAVIATRGLEAQTAPAPGSTTAAGTPPALPSGPALVVINERCSTCHTTIPPVPNSSRIAAPVTAPVRNSLSSLAGRGIAGGSLIGMSTLYAT